MLFKVCSGLRFLLFAFTFAVFISAGLQRVQAADPVANNSSSFESAVALWLNDDDKTSLPRIADMAVSGDERAKLFLTLLGDRPELWTDWVHLLPDAERRALFRPIRDATLRSGGTWWAQDDVPEVIGWVRTPALDHDFIESMKRLITLGEPRLAFARLAPTLKYKDLGEIAGIAETSSLPADLHFFRPLAELIKDPGRISSLPSAPSPDGTLDDRMQLALFYSWATFLAVQGDYAHQLPAATLRQMIESLHAVAENLPYISGEVTLADPESSGKPAWPGRRDMTLNWLKVADGAEHYRGMCQDRCASTQDRCLLSTYLANDGYAAMYAHETPSQNLIPDTRFRQSPRARRLPVRRIALEISNTPERAAARLADIRRGSRCLFTEVGRQLDRLSETTGRR